MATQLHRRQVSQLYRPVGAKPIQTGIAFNPAVGGQTSLSSQVDLTLPIMGLRFRVRMRDVIAVANMTSQNPEAYLNMISRLQITGTNSRQKGAVTLWDIDMATAALLPVFFFRRPFLYTLSTGGAAATAPSFSSGFPFPTGLGNGNIGTYDIEYVIDLPAYPYATNRAQRPGYAIRNEEWKDSIQMVITFGQQANGAAGVLGTDAGGTTHVFSSFGSGAGSPTLDIFSLPFEMGLDIKDSVLPGFVTRASKPVTGILQAALGPGGTIINLDKQPTSRIFVKVGTSTVSPAFATLSDANLSALGISLASNKVVRQELAMNIHRKDTNLENGTEGVLGYTCLDFMQSGNPDSSYPGQLVGEGSTFQLVGTAAGVANARAHIVQEEPLYAATGPLYNF